jgi:hypothetical protein
MGTADVRFGSKGDISVVRGAWMSALCQFQT